jgi:AcrR family transcriptional regulator
MTRLARNRDTPLTRDEIAAEALRQFDAGSTAPSIRQLATALGTTPSAIYHHFPSRAAVYQAGVDLVWGEVIADVLELVPDPFAADPAEVLVSSAVATRRAFMRHHRIAPYASATPASSGMMANTIALTAGLLERLGLEGDEAAAAFHTYAAFTFGTIVFAATRQIAHEELGDRGGGGFRSAPGEHEASFSGEQTRRAIDGVIDVSAVDPARDEALFAAGLRRLIASFGAAG